MIYYIIRIFLVLYNVYNFYKNLKKLYFILIIILMKMNLTYHITLIK